MSLPFNLSCLLLGAPWAVGARAHRSSLREDTDPEEDVAKDGEPEHSAGWEGREPLAGRGTRSPLTLAWPGPPPTEDYAARRGYR